MLSSTLFINCMWFFCIYEFAGMYRKVYQTRSFNAKDKEKVRYMIWTTEMDRCLTKILVEETKKGNKIDNVLKTAAYVAAVKALNEKFGLDLTKDHIKSRLKTWKKQYGVLKDLLTQRGFKWEKAQKMVVADDSAWNNYIKVCNAIEFYNFGNSSVPITLLILISSRRNFVELV